VENRAGCDLRSEDRADENLGVVVVEVAVEDVAEVTVLDGWADVGLVLGERDLWRLKFVLVVVQLLSTREHRAESELGVDDRADKDLGVVVVEIAIEQGVKSATDNQRGRSKVRLDDWTDEDLGVVVVHIAVQDSVEVAGFGET
jgi:hypothetical protein